MTPNLGLWLGNRESVDNQKAGDRVPVAQLQWRRGSPLVSHEWLTGLGEYRPAVREPILAAMRRLAHQDLARRKLGGAAGEQDQKSVDDAATPVPFHSCQNVDMSAEIPFAVRATSVWTKSRWLPIPHR